MSLDSKHSFQHDWGASARARVAMPAAAASAAVMEARAPPEQLLAYYKGRVGGWGLGAGVKTLNCQRRSRLRSHRRPTRRPRSEL